MVQTYTGEDSRFIDFYGPPRSISTVPYHQVLQGGATRSLRSERFSFKGKAVFVGFAEQFQPEQRDGFYTVFSQPDGLDLSGVEIAATTFANLLEGRNVRPLAAPGWALSILLWGLLAGALLLRLPGAAAIAAAGALAIIALGSAYFLFVRMGLWLPLMVPLAVQLPVAVTGALLWQYVDSRRERQRLHRTLGLYLPSGALDRLARHTGDPATVDAESAYGVCMATDAGAFTTLSESMQPDRLRVLLNRYFDVLFAPVRRHGGEISDVVGDAVLALWTVGPEQSMRAAACRAALELLSAVEDFNRAANGARLPTRIGLHCGLIQLGNVGAVDHFEYRAVGDVVNAATRIEGLSKYLGTRILASTEVVADLPGFVTRDLGRFRLAGKTRSLAICELMGFGARDATDNRNLQDMFSSGLHAFRARQWSEAVAAFSACVAQADDGPARYYLTVCDRYRRKPPPEGWDGVVPMRHK